MLVIGLKWASMAWPSNVHPSHSTAAERDGAEGSRRNGDKRNREQLQKDVGKEAKEKNRSRTGRTIGVSLKVPGYNVQLHLTT